MNIENRARPCVLGWPVLAGFVSSLSCGSKGSSLIVSKKKKKKKPCKASLGTVMIGYFQMGNSYLDV
jgi:hypothetical protein